MGWSSGSSLFADIAEVIANTVADDDERRTVYEAMIESFMDRDCDTLDECLGTIPDPVLDAALTEALDIDDNYADDDDDWPDGGREDFT
jgi:hypothetical protein